VLELGTLTKKLKGKEEEGHASLKIERQIGHIEKVWLALTLIAPALKQTQKLQYYREGGTIFTK